MIKALIKNSFILIYQSENPIYKYFKKMKINQLDYSVAMKENYQHKNESIYKFEA